jgi:hypothetical protein
MNLTKNGVTIEIPDAEIVRMALERLSGSAYPVNLKGISVPRIGEIWVGQGGRYGGIARGVDGAPDHHVIMAEAIPTDQLSFKAAIEWAGRLEIEGHHDFILPSIEIEMPILRANLREHFEEEAYWSGTQYAGNDDSAWYQIFYHGNQDYYLKSSELRVRAVRRLPI